MPLSHHVRAPHLVDVPRGDEVRTCFRELNSDNIRHAHVFAIMCYQINQCLNTACHGSLLQLTHFGKTTIDVKHPSNTVRNASVRVSRIVRFPDQPYAISRNRLDNVKPQIILHGTQFGDEPTIRVRCLEANLGAKTAIEPIDSPTVDPMLKDSPGPLPTPYSVTVGFMVDPASSSNPVWKKSLRSGDVFRMAESSFVHLVIIPSPMLVILLYILKKTLSVSLFNYRIIFFYFR